MGLENYISDEVLAYLNKINNTHGQVMIIDSENSLQNAKTPVVAKNYTSFYDYLLEAF